MPDHFTLIIDEEAARGTLVALLSLADHTRDAEARKSLRRFAAALAESLDAAAAAEQYGRFIADDFRSGDRR